jgi:hypothetical protein
VGREKAATADGQGPPRERTIMDAGVHSERSWWLYSDGTFEGETVEGMQRFRDFEHFKSVLASSPAVRAASLSKRHLDEFRSRLTQSSEPPKSYQSQGSENPTAPVIDVRTSALENTAPPKRLAPRIIARLLSGSAALVICLTGWIMLSEAIRFEEAKKLEQARRLEQAEKAKKSEEARKLAETDGTTAIDRLQGVTLSDWNWRAEGYIAILFGSFAVQNNNAFDVKDVEITCNLFGNTGTVVDRNVRMIDDVIKAKSSRTFENFNMGFVHYRGNFSAPVPITSSNCEISNFARAD